MHGWGAAAEIYQGLDEGRDHNVEEEHVWVDGDRQEWAVRPTLLDTFLVLSAALLSPF